MNALENARSIPPLKPVTVLCWFVFCFLGAYAGPFGTYEYDLGPRALFWAGVVIGAALLGRMCRLVAIRVVGKPFSFATDATTVLLITIVFTPVLVLLTKIVLSPENPVSYLRFAQYVAVISASITALRRFLMQSFRWHLEIAEPAQSAQPVEDPRLTRRLPDDFEGPILRLAVRDHFVDVVTPKETHRIRMRFSDAIDEMDTVTGYCTHRSHWVARHAIAGVKRENGRINLLLTNGDLVPVSRSYRPDLEEAGILDIVNHAASGSHKAARP